MNHWTRLAAAAVTSALLLGAGPALADVTACQSGFAEKDPHEQLTQYDICVKNAPYGPALAMAHALRAYAYLQLEQPDKALADLNEAIVQDPRSAAYLIDRGAFYSRGGECAEAVADFDKAISVGAASDRSMAYSGKAWVLATCPDASFRNGPEAIDMAQRGLKLKNDAAGHDSLAAAYAESGQFKEAVAEEAKAVAALGDKLGPDMLAIFRARLDLYMRGTPLSQAPGLATPFSRFVVDG